MEGPTNQPEPTPEPTPERSEDRPERSEDRPERSEDRPERSEDRLDKPLAAARKRLNRLERKRKIVEEFKQNPPPDLANPDVILGLTAAGIPQAKIARALDVPADEVRTTLQGIPNHSERIQAIREKLKLGKILAMERIEAKLYPRLEREVEAGEPKDIDALTRSAASLEKIQSAVSGEGQKIDVTGMPESPVADIKVLIQQLLADSDGSGRAWP